MARFDTEQKNKKTRSTAETMRTFRDPRVVRDDLFLYYDVSLEVCPSEFDARMLEQSDEIAIRILHLPSELGRAYHVAIQFALDEASAGRRRAGLRLSHVKRALERVGYKGFFRSKHELDLLDNATKWLWLWITDAVIGDEPAPMGKPRGSPRQITDPPFETNREYWARMKDTTGG